MRKIFTMLLSLGLSVAGSGQTKPQTIFDSGDFVLAPMDSINTTASDISPAIVENNLYFSSVRESYLNSRARERKKTAFYAVYRVPQNQQGAVCADCSRILVPEFSSNSHQGPVSYCASTGELFVTQSNISNPDTIIKLVSETYFRLKLVVMKKQQGKWELSEELPFNNPKYNYGHPAISTTGDTLIFSSNMKGGFGKSDLYISIRKDKKWSVPVNLGAQVNTSGEELFPTFLPGGLLSFSSDGRLGGNGKLDIWYTTFPNVEEIKNAGNKINTQFDDFGLVVRPDGLAAYFSSNRPGRGSDDIYRLDIKPYLVTYSGLVVHAETGASLSGSSVTLFDCKGKALKTVITDGAGKFSADIAKGACCAATAQYAGFDDARKEFHDSDFVELRLNRLYQQLRITVTDRKTGQPVSNAVLSITGGKYNNSMIAQNEGKAQVDVDLESGYNLSVTAKGYMSKDVVYSLKGIKEYLLEIKLDKIEEGAQFVMEDLYYDFNKYTIRKDAEPVLDRLAKILIDNPEVKIEIGSHTDSRGSAASNMMLSQKRSESVVAYLVGKGINRNRLVAKGYGETQLINKCADGVDCSENEHQANRRTVIEILNQDVHKVKRGEKSIYYF